ncbi:hypothetical protein [Romboutsia weinsteinii]|nr:hypothetical protein [Romboutsia weinsteinii]
MINVLSDVYLIYESDDYNIYESLEADFHFIDSYIQGLNKYV